MYGYEIAKELERQNGEALPMNPGALYPVLRSLEKQGLLSSYSELSDSGRARKYYEVTKGRRRDHRALANRLARHESNLSTRFWRMTMTTQTKYAVAKYRRNLEKALESAPRDVRSEAIQDADEFLSDEVQAMDVGRLTSERAAYDRFIERFRIAYATCGELPRAERCPKSHWRPRRQPVCLRPPKATHRHLIDGDPNDVRRQLCCVSRAAKTISVYRC